jgi:hypothetical protein
MGWKMNDSFQCVRESLMRELVAYRSLACAGTRQEEPAPNQQLNFWFESAIFWIMQLQVSDEEGNPANYGEALNKARECVDRLQILLG